VLVVVPVREVPAAPAQAQITFDHYLDRCFALHEAGTDILPENTPHWGVGGRLLRPAGSMGWLEVSTARTR
jgi:hypothetical protein